MNGKRIAALLLALLLVLMSGAAAEVVSGPLDAPVEEMEWSLGDPMGDFAEGAGEDGPRELMAAPLTDGGEDPAGAPAAADITEASDAVPAPEQLSLPKKLTLGKGEKLQLTPQLLPEGAACALRYESSAPKIVKVSGTGLLTAKKKGRATVTVTTDNGLSASVKLTVKAAPKRVSITAKKTHLLPGESVKLKAKLPSGAGGSVAFAAKSKVVEVTAEGKVTALKAGTAKVTATAYNGKSATIEITVLPPFEITFMDVGRNDGILIQCGGEYAFIDSGMRGQGLKAADYMKSLDVDHLKYYIGTHAHKDHIGGAAAILAAVKTDTVIVSHSATASRIRGFAETAEEKKAVKKPEYRTVKRGETFKLGDASFLVLGPVNILDVDPGSVPENGNSLILKLTYGKNTFLLTGDATGTEIKQVETADPGCMRAQVFKNPHHYGKQEYAAIVFI